MKISGTRQKGKVQILVDGKELTPYASQKVWNHSPNGFEFGYSGSGPAQLALAILLAAGASPEDAVTYHQTFKREVIAGLHKEDFEIDIEFAPCGYLWKINSVNHIPNLPT